MLVITTYELLQGVLVTITCELLQYVVITAHELSQYVWLLQHMSYYSLLVITTYEL